MDLPLQPATIWRMSYVRVSKEEMRRNYASNRSISTAMVIADTKFKMSL